MRPWGRAEGKASWALHLSPTSGAEVPVPCGARPGSSEKPRRHGLQSGFVRACATLGLPRVAFSLAVKVEGGKPGPAGV